MDRPAYLILPALLLCTSCDVPTTWSEKDIRRIAGEEVSGIRSTIDHNAQVANERGDRLKRLEQRIDDLERQTAQQQIEIARLRVEALRQ